MKRYKFLPHTADVRIEAYGKNLEKAFCNAAYAVTEIITEQSKIKKVFEKEIRIESENKESLLYDFLEQFLILLDSEGFLLAEVLEIKIENNYLTAKVSGDNQENYQHKTHVKAITYQEMQIKKNSEGVEIHLIVDI